MSEIVSALPKYMRVYLLLRHRIERGDLHSGAVMPAVEAVAHDYDVAMATARLAMAQLARNGLIVRRQGRRNRVR